MYSNRSPPTVPAGMELPYISIPSTCVIVPSTGISRLRIYSSIVGAVYMFVIRDFQAEAIHSFDVCPTRSLTLRCDTPCHSVPCLLVAIRVDVRVTAASSGANVLGPILLTTPYIRVGRCD